MKALRWHGRGDVRLDEVAPPPPPSAGEVQLAVQACGICGTDVEEWREGPLLIPVDRPHPLTGAIAPITLGHEVAGEVVATGDRTGLEPGQMVAVDGLVSCGVCRECLLGRPNLCAIGGQVGLMADGGLQPLLNVPAVACVGMPVGLAPEAGALAETLSVVVRAVGRARMRAGDRVVVHGGGAVGLLAVQVARAMAAGHVTLVEPLASRRALGVRLGADDALDPTEVDGRCEGYDVAVECSGAPAAVLGAVRSARRGGRIVLVGINRARPPLDAWDVVSQEKEIIGSFSHVRTEDFVGALGLLSSPAIAYEEMLTRIPLGDSLGGGLLALAERPADFLKIVVVPDGMQEKVGTR